MVRHNFRKSLNSLKHLRKVFRFAKKWKRRKDEQRKEREEGMGD